MTKHVTNISLRSCVCNKLGVLTSCWHSMLSALVAGKSFAFNAAVMSLTATGFEAPLRSLAGGQWNGPRVHTEIFGLKIQGDSKNCG